MQRAVPSAMRVLIVACGLLALLGCASMQQRVADSENRAVTLEAQVADLQANQQNIIARLTQIREDLEVALDPLRTLQADSGATLTALESNVTALQQQVELLTGRIDTLSPGGATPSSPETTPGATPSTPETTPGGNASAPSTRTTVSEQNVLFNAAYMDYTAAQYVLAVSGFEEYLSRYPQSARVADAMYWIGESLAAQDLHADARRRFLEVTQRFPTAAKVPDALLRAALEAVALGQVNDAVRELRQLVAAHADTDAGQVGCLQLDRMGESLPTGCQ